MGENAEIKETKYLHGVLVKASGPFMVATTLKITSIPLAKSLLI